MFLLLNIYIKFRKISAISSETEEPGAFFIVPLGIYGRMMLRSARVEGIAITC